MATKYVKAQISDADSLARLAERATVANSGAALSEIARRDLARYYDMLNLALSSVELSAGEAGLIVDALNGTVIDVLAAQMLAAEIEDSIDELAPKWDVDGQVLVKKAAGWTLAQRLAVCDAAERFWGTGYQASTIDGLVAVGLVKRG